jgi:translocator protein
MNAINVSTHLDRARLLRYTALCAIATNILFNFLSITLFSHPSVEEVIYSYPILFTPAGYSFSIWIVHILFIGYALIQIAPERNYKPAFDRLAIPLIITNIFELGWQYAFVRGQLGIGMLFLAGMLISACSLYVYAQKHLEQFNLGIWWRIPFNLYLAWTSIIVISATSSWLASIGWTIEGITEMHWTILMIFVTGTLGALMAFGRQDAVYPLVMSWAILSLWIKYSQVSTDISMAALGVGLFLIWCAVVATIQSPKVAEKVFENQL